VDIGNLLLHKIRIKALYIYLQYSTVYSSLPYFPTIYVTYLGYIGHLHLYQNLSTTIKYLALSLTSFPIFQLLISVTHLGYVLRGLLYGLEGVTG
jgi:hypothetical protein